MLPKKLKLSNAIAMWFASSGFQREMACFVAEGMGLVAMSTEDKGAHVSLDFHRIWTAMKAAPRMPKIAYIYHTHPPSFCSMSSEDENSVKGWATALGMPVDMYVLSAAGTRRYRSLPGNIVVDHGIRTFTAWSVGPSMVLENFLASAMWGLSSESRPCTDKEFDGIVEELNEVIPVETWDFFEYPTAEEIIGILDGIGIESP